MLVCKVGKGQANGANGHDAALEATTHSSSKNQNPLKYPSDSDNEGDDKDTVSELSDTEFTHSGEYY